MNVYIYQAALLCESCGNNVKAILQEKGLAPQNPNDEYSYDSDDYPKGLYPDGGGESDCPNHCDICGLFLENPLTQDGENYVKECTESDHIPDDWLEFYAYLWDGD